MKGAQEISLALKIEEEPQPEECGWPGEAGKSKQQTFSCILQKELYPAETSALPP